MRQEVFVVVIALSGLFAAGDAAAAILARDQLVTPLAPDLPSNLSIPMPSNVDPNQPIWVSYRVLALSPTASPTGEIVLDGSFEGAPTPIQQSVATLTPEKMTVSASAGTIKQQFESRYGPRTPEEMQTLLGPELYQAYEAVNAGNGRILDGTVVKTLPALGKNEGVLLISVERANGIRPVGVFVTVGQGEIPADMKPGESGSGGSSFAYSAGRIVGLLFMLGLLYWFFVARHKKN